MFKVMQSIFNATVAVFFASLFHTIEENVTLEFLQKLYDKWQWKVSCIAIFFLVCNVLCEYWREKCLGMTLFSWFLYKTRYAKKRTLRQKLPYMILYTLSFSTLVFSWELFLLNMGIQVICFIKKKNTLHGYITDVETVYEEDLSTPAS